MTELIRNAWLGWQDYTEHGKMAALLLLALLLYWFGNKRSGSKEMMSRRHTLVSYTTVMTVCCICPLTAAALMAYQTKFYDYQWIWGAVPVTIVIALAATQLWTELADKYTGGDGAGWKRAGITVLFACVIYLCGSMQSAVWDEDEAAQNRQKAERVLEIITENGQNKDICLWAPQGIMEYARALDGSIVLPYGRNMWGSPTDSSADFAWLQHMISHLSPKGKIGMVLANGSLSSQTGGEGEIRKNIIEADLVECIVAMPTQLFYTTQIPVCLWFLSKDKKQKGKTLFIDARKMGEMVTRKLRELTEEDILKIAQIYNEYIEGTLKDEKGFCAVVDTEEIRKQDYILTPGRYVGIEEQEDDGEPFEEKMERLTSELSELFKKSHNLEQEIREKLGAIGYEI